MKSIRYWVILLSGLGFSFCPAWGDDATKPPETPTVTADETDTDADDDPDTDTDTDAPDPAKDAERAQALATEFGVTEQQVLDMRTTSKMGWGEIKNLLLIAQAVSLDSQGTATPLTMDQALQQVLTQRASGMGLGQIANSYNHKLGDLRKGDAAAAKGGKPETAGRPEKAAKPDKPGKPDKAEKPDKPDKPEKAAKPDKPEKPEKAAKPDKPEKPDNPGKGR